MLKDPEKRAELTSRQFMALMFRTEQKRILVNQIVLVKIAMHILERLMKGLTLEFAVTRVFELESKMDHPINRLMLQTYLKKVEIGLKKNQKEYYENIAGDLAQNCRDMKIEEKKQEGTYEKNSASGEVTMKETHKLV